MAERLTWSYAPEGQKRRYVTHFVSKLTDANGEQAEMQHWLDTATACNYFSEKEQDACLRNAQELVKCSELWWQSLRNSATNDGSRQLLASPRNNF